MSESEAIQRERMEFDVVIVGAGPAGLAAAIRLRQLREERGHELSVCVIEKGSEVGAHIFSGAVVEPRALGELIPDWREAGAPLVTEVKEERFLMLSESGSISVPVWALPPQMQNHGNYVGSLGLLVRWLGERAEALGVEVYPGFPAAETLFDEEGRVIGVATGDMGIGRDGQPKDTFEPGMELVGKYTLFAEGCRGSLTRRLVERFDLAADSDPQTYGIGLKELWELDPAQHREGLVMHTAGWPVDRKTWGGSFVYHFENNQAYVGYVVGLDYQNPHLSPFQEFQRFKTHPAVRPMLEGGKRIAYGARALNEGGLQSIPKLVFPGGMLIGCSAGFLNVPKIKGSHTAMKSGMVAAEAVFDALAGGDEGGRALTTFPERLEASWVYEELRAARNFRPAFARWGLIGGTLYGGFDLKVLGGKAPWTFHHHRPDYATLVEADKAEPIDYPKPDGVITFDRNSSVFLTGTFHEEDQPVHLTLANDKVPIEHNLAFFDAPEQRYCPAGVYEIVRDGEEGQPRLQINAQNCIHCKTCDIKDPLQNIRWVTPEGGGGPNYANM